MSRLWALAENTFREAVRDRVLYSILFFAVGVLPQTSAEAALSEARHCIETLGMRGVWRRPERIEGTPALHDPSYESLWAYLEDADRPFALHPGLNGIVPCQELRHRFDDDYGAMHAVHFPMEQMMGQSQPASDLYAAAMTLLVVATRVRPAFSRISAAMAERLPDWQMMTTGCSSGTSCRRVRSSSSGTR